MHTPSAGCYQPALLSSGLRGGIDRLSPQAESEAPSPPSRSVPRTPACACWLLALPAHPLSPTADHPPSFLSLLWVLIPESRCRCSSCPRFSTGIPQLCPPAEKVRFFSAKGPRDEDSQVSPASRLQSSFSKSITCSLLPSLRTLSLKGGKNRKRQRKRTGEAQRGKGDCP